jgi:hypothetical protein
MISLTVFSYRHQLNHTPKQIYNCDFPDCARTFVRQDLCNRHRDRHTAKGSQLHRKDSMMGHGSPVLESGKPGSMHGSASPEVMRAGLTGKQRASHLNQFQSPQDINHVRNSYSPITNPSTTTYSRTGSSNGADHFVQSHSFKRSNSDRQEGSATPQDRPQRHASFGVSDGLKPEFVRPPLQTNVGQYGMLAASSGAHSYQGSQPSPHSFVNQQNFTPFSLPPPNYPPASTTASSRDIEPTWTSSMPPEYPNEGIHHQQSGPDMLALQEMTVPNTMPVFGGEGYNRSPFAIPDDFVAFLFSGQQMENTSSPMGQMSQPGYAKYVAYLKYKSNNDLHISNNPQLS